MNPDPLFGASPASPSLGTLCPPTAHCVIAGHKPKASARKPAASRSWGFCSSLLAHCY